MDRISSKYAKETRYKLMENKRTSVSLFVSTVVVESSTSSHLKQKNVFKMYFKSNQEVILQILE